MTENSYEAFPYTNEPYYQTHIAHLFLVARLFNLSPRDFRQARVLELGCGGGGNLIPMADQYPASRFLGIDLSPRQIGQGQELVAVLGLSNIELRAESILDFAEAAEPFDYIVCHGTFSWVPEEVRQKILAIVARTLAPDGVALISYNVYPGWSGPGVLRDMMLFHTAAETTPAAKVAAAKNLLQLIVDGQTGDADGYRAMVQAELANIRASRDEYVLHEYLDENNKPFYFQEFASLASRHGLAHLSDSDLGLAYPGNYPPPVRALAETISDPLRLEQYLDFVNNTRFRYGILVRQAQKIERRIDPSRIEEFWIDSALRPVPPEPKPPLSSAAPIAFVNPSGRRLALRDTGAAAMLLTLFHHGGRALRLGELATQAKRRFDLPEPESELRHRYAELALRFARSHVVSLRADPGRHVTAISARPIGLPAARVLARHTSGVPNALHEVVMLDSACQWLLPLLDGTADRASLAAAARAALGRGELSAQHEVVPGMVVPTGPALADALVHGTLGNLAANALLIG